MRLYWLRWKKKQLEYLSLVRGTIDEEILSFYNLYSFEYSIKTGYFLEQIKERMENLSESEKYLFLLKLQLIENCYGQIALERAKLDSKK